MRVKLISHYELASLVESNNPQKDSIRKKLAKRILAEMHNVSDTDRAYVLSLHTPELQHLNLGNAIRRMAQRYGIR